NALNQARPVHGDPGRGNPHEHNDADPDQPPDEAGPAPLVRPQHDVVEVCSEAGDEHHGNVNQDETEEAQQIQEMNAPGTLAVEEHGEAPQAVADRWRHREPGYDL